MTKFGPKELMRIKSFNYFLWHWTPIPRRHLSTSLPRPFASTQDERLWVRSPKPDIDLVKGKTIPELLWEQVAKWSQMENLIAFECGVTGQKYGYKDLYRQSKGFGAALLKLGVQRNDMIGLCLPNCPEYPVALLGSWEAGCVVTTMNPGYTVHEVSVQFSSAKPKFVVTTPELLPRIEQAQQSCTSLKQIILVGSSSDHPNCLAFSELVKTDPTACNFLKGSQLDVAHTCLLPYSSGTTGPPKGVELTHQNLTINIMQHMAPDVTAARQAANGSGERFLGLLPFYHSYGLNMFCLHGIYVGAHTLCLPKFDPEAFVKAIRQHRPTLMHLVPPLLSFICQSPDIGQKELESVHTIVPAAAPVGEVLINKFLNKAGKFIHVQEGWGMTELSPMALLVNPSMGNNKIGSCGTLIPNTIAKVVDLTTGEAQGANKRGELCIKGPQVMKGYYKNGEVTAKTIDPQGWLHTGDIACYDEDGWFYIVDRIKELIKVKGYQVAPSELEDLLRQIDGVMDVAVIGIPDEKAGELPRAYIVRRNEELTETKVHVFLEEKVSPYKQLNGGVEFVQVIPKSAAGKILRRELLAEYKMKHNI